MNTPIIPKTTLAILAAGLFVLSSSRTGARDRFEYDPTPKKPAPEAPSPSPGGSNRTGVSLTVGEVRPAFEVPSSGPEMAFYVPETSPTIVQVVVEKKLFHRPSYFLKGI